MTDEHAGRQLLDTKGVASAEKRLVDGLRREFRGGEEVFLAGIPTRGVTLANRLARALGEEGVACGLGMVDISMHRDDLGMREGVSVLRGTELPLDLDR